MKEKVFAKDKTWFTSDTHFGHKNIIKYCNRPYDNIDNMDKSLISNWNSVVKPGDDIFHLGDFSFNGEKNISKYSDQLNGKIHLIWGNHDRSEAKSLPSLASSSPYQEIKINEESIILFHYAMKVWNKSFHGSIHLFGHSHGQLEGNKNSVDVGIDLPEWKYTPVNYNQIKDYLKTKE